MFDLRTHIRDAKSGEITKVQPYQRVCEGGAVHYVRNGIRYEPSGKPYPGQNIPLEVEPEAKPTEVGELRKVVEALERRNAFLETKMDQLLEALKPTGATAAPTTSAPAAVEAKPLTGPNGEPLAPSMPDFAAEEHGMDQRPARRGRPPVAKNHEKPVNAEAAPAENVGG